MFAPLLFINYKLSTVQFTLLLVFVFLFKTNTGMARQLFELRFQGWKQVFTIKIAFVLMSFIFIKVILSLIGQPRLLLITCAIFLITLGFLTKIRIDMKGCFFDDVAREQRHRLRYASLLLSMSGISVKRPKSPKRRPLFLRNSNHLFRKRDAVNLLVELCLKSVLRNNNTIPIAILAKSTAIPTNHSLCVNQAARPPAIRAGMPTSKSSTNNIKG
ncbi:ABC transporter permease [Pelotomaculum isophthalicicum]|uniref:ABC transporter permease n=1 Tax=Pelotomaculum isophthalicicum TaxID=342448 RepID=UPI003B847C46